MGRFLGRGRRPGRRPAAGALGVAAALAMTAVLVGCGSPTGASRPSNGMRAGTHVATPTGPSVRHVVTGSASSVMAVLPPPATTRPATAAPERTGAPSAAPPTADHATVLSVPGTASAPASTVAPPTTTTGRTSGPSTPTSGPPSRASGSPARTSAARPAFRSSISGIDAALARRMHTSYYAGCPVPLADLRYLHLTYLGFDGRAHTGEMVVSARVAQDVVTAFRTLYADRFPIRQMRLVDDFGGSDDASMAADNTSAFNCRPVTGGTGWSEHSYGEAIDINPVQNPYVSGSTVLPPAGRAYLDRPDRPGVIHPGGAAVRAFAAIGWTWGGTWDSPVDLQHFSRSGR